MYIFEEEKSGSVLYCSVVPYTEMIMILNRKEDVYHMGRKKEN